MEVWRRTAAGFVMLAALAATVGPALARQYGPGDISYLVNLWDTNRSGFKGTVQGIDTFSALGTVNSISKAADGSTFDVLVDVGLNTQVSCSANSAEAETGDTVTVSGRIDSVATAGSQMHTNKTGDSGRARDSLKLKTCTVEKALKPKKK
jgi:hypothetical protein